MEKSDLALSPWLVIPYGKDENSQAFYNICEPNNTSCKKSIPELKGKSFYQKNRHQGWLIVLCDNEEYDYKSWKYGDCFLWNPLSMETIKLPSFLHWLDDDIYLNDCLLTSPPKPSTCNGDRNCMVFMLLTACDVKKNILVYCHPGDRGWISHTIGYRYGDDYNVGDLQSMCYFNSKLHIMCRGYDHLEINIQSKNKPKTLSIRTIKISDDILCAFRGYKHRTYCVESSDGGIFMIEKYYITRGVYEYSYMWTIAKLDFSSMSWVEVTSLDDHVLFVNRYTQLSCSAKELGFTRGCLYFTQRNEMSLYKYDLEDNSITLSMPCPDLPNPWFSANWLMIPKELHIQENGGDGTEVLKTMQVSRISLKNDDDEKVNVDEAKPWVLEDDMVWSISNYLNPVDNIHFRAVCKTYKSIVPLLNRRSSCPAKCLQTSGLSPWLVFPKNDEAIYSFINPMHNNENYLMSIPELLKGSVIRFSKGGWLLMSKGYDSLFFYNPFTKAVIKLPDLPDDVFGYSHRGICFSSLPTSSDCVVFAIGEYLYDEVEIIVTKRGDKEWTNNVFKNDYLPPNRINMVFQPSFSSPVFYNGALYCLDLNGTLGVCTLENGIRWEILSMVPPPNSDSIHTSYLVEFEGKLLSVLLGQYGKWVRCFRMDLAEMAWIEVEHLGRHALFISNTSCVATIAPTSQMENKIYFPRMQNEGILFYSLESGRYHSLGSEHSSTDYCNSKHSFWCSWMEPNWSETTRTNFDWS